MIICQTFFVYTLMFCNGFVIYAIHTELYVNIRVHLVYLELQWPDSVSLDWSWWGSIKVNVTCRSKRVVQIRRQCLPSANAYERKQLLVPRARCLTHHNFQCNSTLSPHHLDLKSIKKRDPREVEATVNYLVWSSKAPSINSPCSKMQTIAV